MRNNSISKKIAELEKAVGLKEMAIIIFNKDYNKNAQYYFEIDGTGNEIYYCDDKRISYSDLKDRAEEIITLNVQYV